MVYANVTVTHGISLITAWTEVNCTGLTLTPKKKQK